MLRQVPLDKGCGQQDLLSEKITDEASSGLWHDILFLSKRFHVLANVISRYFCAFEDGAHFCKFRFQMVRYLNVTLHNSKEGLVSDSIQDLFVS